MTSWAVPNWGYGIANARRKRRRNPSTSTAARPSDPNEIDHFEVMTFDGKRLVEVNV